MWLVGVVIICYNVIFAATSHLYFFVHFLMFFALYKTLLKEHLRSFKNRDHANMAIYLIISTRTSTARACESRDFHVRGTA